MRTVKPVILAVLVAAATSTGFTQAPPQSSAASPIFEIVSIKRNVTNQGANPNQRPDGGFTLTNIPVTLLISRAYPPAAPREMAGLPEWATRDLYDVSATSSLSSPTPDQRMAMMRAMLADRFKLLVHTESRDQPVYDLVLARGDGRLGSGLTQLDVDCARSVAERAAAPLASLREPPDFTLPPPPCTVRGVNAFLRDKSGDKQGRLGDLLEGETTMDDLANTLRAVGVLDRAVVNKTGLRGSYRVRMNYDVNAFRRGPDVNATPGAPPSIFVAVQEQLGLKLESSVAPRDTLIIDRLERPTEN